ncbi:MAG TPA: hypothetical protein VFK44_01395 [Bacillales bacterium]|nr:hypothetical protein [Bacillales bacterium]
MKPFTRTIRQPHMWLAVVVMAFLAVPIGGQDAAAAGESPHGFVIHANRISGDMLPPTIVVKNGRPLLRFRYRSAVIRGLSMTKQLATPEGPMTVKVHAASAEAKNMKVDASAFTFGGACLTLGEARPQLVLKNVTMVAHYQSASRLRLEQAKIGAVPGRHGLDRPSAPDWLQQLQQTSAASLREAIEKLMNGNVPLLPCSSGKDDGQNKQTSVVGKGMHGDEVDKVEQTAKTIEQAAAGTVNGAVDGIVGGQTGKAVGGLLDEAEAGELPSLPEDLEQTVCDGVEALKKRLGELESAIDELEKTVTAATAKTNDELTAVDQLKKRLQEIHGEIEPLVAAEPDRENFTRLKEQAEDLKRQEEELRQLKGAANDRRLKLEQLQARLNSLQQQAAGIDVPPGCSSVSADEATDALRRLRQQTETGRELLDRLGHQIETSEAIVKTIVREAETYLKEAQQAWESRLLSGITDALRNLANEVEDVLTDIKKE